MINDALTKLEQKMVKTLTHLKEEFNHIRAGRANPQLLDKISVEYYGSMTPLKQLAAISVPEPRMIQVQPYDVNALADVEKAIMMSDLGINPNNDGKVIRLVLPVLTEERRKDLAKQVKKIGEDAKVAVRNERRDANDSIKKLQKNGEITEDDLVYGEKEVQKHVDACVAKIDEEVKKKMEEVMEV